MSLAGDEQVSEVATGARVLLRQGEERGVACAASASDSHIAPQLSTFINGVDASHHFTSLNYSQTQQGVVSMVSKSSFVTMSPKPEYHLQNVTCVASMPNFPVESTYAMFNIEWKWRELLVATNDPLYNVLNA